MKKLCCICLIYSIIENWLHIFHALKFSEIKSGHIQIWFLFSDFSQELRNSKDWEKAQGYFLFPLEDLVEVSVLYL